MSVSMKQVIGLWGVTYLEVAKYLGFKSSSVIEKRVKQNTWKHHEVISILQEVENQTGVAIDPKLINK